MVLILEIATGIVLGFVILACLPALIRGAGMLLGFAALAAVAVLLFLGGAALWSAISENRAAIVARVGPFIAAGVCVYAVGTILRRLHAAHPSRVTAWLFAWVPTDLMTKYETSAGTFGDLALGMSALSRICLTPVRAITFGLIPVTMVILLLMLAAGVIAIIVTAIRSLL